MSSTLIQPQSSVERGADLRADVWRAIAVCGLLVLAVLLVFGRTLNQGFLTIDDLLLVSNEPHVSGGLSWSGIAWAFSNGPAGEWYPLAMLSHMLDCQLYGLNPAGHHLTNVLLHAASSVALFLVLWRMTAELWPCALVAAVFALHPLHVESVAWVAERRDVLSGLFFMLTLAAYTEYVRHPRSLGRYLALLGLFSLGLMSKPILVTVPPLLLLLDFWPLGRFGGTGPHVVERNSLPASFPWRVVVEKLPLFALAIAVGVVTMFTHNPWQASLTLPERAANAAISCVAYLGQLFVPVGLSIFYPHPEAGRPAWQVAAAATLLLAITAAAVIGRRSYPYFFVGWFWYVGMLVPVLGLTYVGGESRADRYTYLSQIGLSIALVWSAMRLGASWPARRWVFGIGSAFMLAALMACSWRQTGFWQDDRTLWEHALACDPTNVRAHCILGSVLQETDEKAAIAQYRQALEVGPTEQNIYAVIRAKAHNGLGDIAARKGDVADATAQYEQALELDPGLQAAHLCLGNLLAEQGKIDAAVVHFKRITELASDGVPAAYCNLGIALARSGKTDEGIANLRKATQADPNFGLAQMNLAVLLAERDDVDEAITHFRRAIEIDPDVALPYYQIAGLLRKQGKTSEAAKFDDRGRKASRRYAENQNLRGTEMAQQGKTSEAIAQFQTAIAVAPDYAPAHCNLADALALQGNIDDAKVHYRRALTIDPNFALARKGLERLSKD